MIEELLTSSVLDFGSFGLLSYVIIYATKKLSPLYQELSNLQGQNSEVIRENTKVLKKIGRMLEKYEEAR